MPLTSLLIIAGVILVAIVVGGVVVRSDLRPVRFLTDAVKHLVETKGFHPVTVPHATGEVAQLASWFNRLLRGNRPGPPAGQPAAHLRRGPRDPRGRSAVRVRPLFRGQTGRATPGTGLGLSIVAKTVEAAELA